MTAPLVLPYIFDLELSGKCNTSCSFCPREEMKRGEKFMTEETFENFFQRFCRYANYLEGLRVLLPEEKALTVLGRAEQSPLRVILCGMGESLMNPLCGEWVKRIRKELGVRVSVVTNGLLLKEKMLQRLVEADITVILVSVPAVDKTTYERYMKIDWDRVLYNISKANDYLPGRVQINATIPDDASFTDDEVMKFWSERSIPVAGISRCHNRGGHLKDSSLTGLHGKSSSSFCGIMARHNFIAWDGQVLSCCHDLHADNVLGNVNRDEFLEIAQAKSPVISQGARYKICRNCNDSERCYAGQILVKANLKEEVSGNSSEVTR